MPDNNMKNKTKKSFILISAEEKLRQTKVQEGHKRWIERFASVGLESDFIDVELVGDEVELCRIEFASQEALKILDLFERWKAQKIS